METREGWETRGARRDTVDAVPAAAKCKEVLPTQDLGCHDEAACGFVHCDIASHEADISRGSRLGSRVAFLRELSEGNTEVPIFLVAERLYRRGVDDTLVVSDCHGHSILRNRSFAS